MAINCFVPQGPSVINQTLISAAQRTASDATTYFPVDFFSSADVTLVITTCSGTFNAYVQKKLPDDSTPMDIAAFPQFVTGTFTTTGTYSLAFVNGGNSMKVQTDAALTAGTVITTNFGSQWRIKFVITGSANFGVYGNFSQ